MKAKIVEPYNKIVARTAQLARLQVGSHFSFFYTLLFILFLKVDKFQDINSEEVKEFERKGENTKEL